MQILTKYFIIILLQFELAANAQMSVLYDFDSTDARYSYSTLVFDGTFLYGTTANGGLYNKGTIFKIKTDGTSFYKLFDFDSINGSSPFCGVMLDSSILYGITEYGGNHNRGTIYKINIDGTGFSKLFDFNGNDGGHPSGKLILIDEYFYGTTNSGTNASLSGTVFKIKKDGSNHKLLHQFNYSDGGWPVGALTNSGDYLYGLTSDGGQYSSGVLFRIKTDSTDYSVLHDFNNNDGLYPCGTLFLYSNYFYGMTASGGAYGSGTFFKIKNDGTDWTKLLDFTNIQNSGSVFGSVISSGGTFYGVASCGGLTTDGSIFKILPDGTNYVTLHSFHNEVDGTQPFGDLVSDGMALYGTTSNWLSDGAGCIFKYDLLTGLTSSFLPVKSGFYPNPSNGIFEFTNDLATPSEIEIYNYAGQMIYSIYDIRSSNITIDLSKQSSGIYIARVFNNKDYKTYKLVIQ